MADIIQWKRKSKNHKIRKRFVLSTIQSPPIKIYIELKLLSLVAQQMTKLNTNTGIYIFKCVSLSICGRKGVCRFGHEFVHLNITSNLSRYYDKSNTKINSISSRLDNKLISYNIYTLFI